jgi:diaminohydroxyphosphoribosylaminopyrimidine deaminase/5-amino-6-(5-phosphoribosylamino)uracil reductase
MTTTGGTADMPVTPADDRFLGAALELAERGLFTTTPNPRVGCVIVRDGRVIARGWHERAGGPHAEAMALANASESVAGATCYVSLEPCAHVGRTPPCANALIEARVGRIVAAMEDPDVRVGGRGFELLRQAGIRVELTGNLDIAKRARVLNVGFCSRVERRVPWVRLKVAASLDGRTAMASGESRWITGTAARADVQYWRARSCALVTGVGTVLADDPRLTVRDIAPRVGGEIRQPLRVIVDSKLSTPPGAAVLQPPGKALMATTRAMLDTDRARALQNARVEVVATDGDRVDIAMLMSILASRGINEVTVEAGPRLTASFVAAACWDEALFYYAPKLLGASARPLADFAVDRLLDAYDARITDTALVGGDLRVTLARH